MWNLSRFTHFSWGKIWFERFALCKKYDISQLWSQPSGKCDKLQLGRARVIVCNGMCNLYLCSRLELAAISNAGAASDNSAWANLALIEQSAEQSDHCRLIIALIQTHFLLFHCTVKSSNPLSSWSGQKTPNTASISDYNTRHVVKVENSPEIKMFNSLIWLQ